MPDKTIKVTKPLGKMEMLEQAPVGMANSTPPAKKKPRKIKRKNERKGL